jgi:hypothetical protein
VVTAGNWFRAAKKKLSALVGELRAAWPREEIDELELRIEELAEALERCRKFTLAPKIAIVVGALLTTATLLGFLTFTPMAMLGGVAALLGGIVVYGSNGSTSDEFTKSPRDAEARRAALVGRLDIRLVDVPPTRH